MHYQNIHLQQSVIPLTLGYRNDPFRFRTKWSIATSNISALLLCHTWRSAAKKAVIQPTQFTQDDLFCIHKVSSSNSGPADVLVVLLNPFRPISGQYLKTCQRRFDTQFKQRGFLIRRITQESKENLQCCLYIITHFQTLQCLVLLDQLVGTLRD